MPGGHNGCDTPNDTLRAQLANPVIKPGTGGCKVVSGLLHDPYTGRDLVAGPDPASNQISLSQVDLDHVVSLATAYTAGANDWPMDRRRNFANDPRNLVATHESNNAGKRDKTPDQWLPPNRSYHCTYARVTVTVLAAYELTVAKSTRDALLPALDSCPSESQSR
jgi:uncharacterized protein DUF1524